MIENGEQGLRTGIAGVHDVLGRDNLNVDMKKSEEVKKVDTIFLPKPEFFNSAAISFTLIQLPHDERSGTAIFPLGLGYLARILRDIGVNVNIIDAHAEQLSVDQVISKTYDQRPSFVGISALSTQYGIVKALKKMKIYYQNFPLPWGAACSL